MSATAGDIPAPARIYIAILALAATAVLVGTALAVDAIHEPWLLLAFAAPIALDHAGLGVSILHLRENERVSIEEAFIVAMAFLFPPGEILLTFAAAVLVGNLLYRRPPLKVVFNVGQLTLAVGAALGVMTLLHGPWLGGAAGIGAVLAGAMTFFVVNTLALAVLFSVLEERPVRAVLASRSQLPTLSFIGAVSVGVLAGLAGQASPAGLGAGLAAAVALELVLTRERTAQLDRERVGRLLAASRSIHSSIEAQMVGAAVTEAARGMLRCTSVRLDLDEPGPDELGTSIDAGASEPLWLVASGPLAERGFEERDRQVLETLAAIASTALANAALYDQVQDERRKLEESQAELLQAQKMEAIGRLAGGVAHDFNNMLTVIQHSAEFVASELPSDHPARPDVQEILTTVARAAELVAQLLTFARKEMTSPRPLNLAEVVDRLTGMLRRIVGQDVRLDISLAEDLWEVTMDPVHVEQVIVNLVVNARDAVRPGDSVVITAANEPVVPGHAELAPGRYVHLCVSDSGTGMDQQTMQRIFEPFFTTKPVGEGTGLGLSTVYGIVERYGGKVLVSSAPGEGASFDIYLPVRRSEPEDSPPARSLASST